MGTGSNPFSSTGFMCFNDYSDIQYSDTDQTYDPPFVNWWMLGTGIQNQPYILCFTFVCQTCVYDGHYTIFNGSISLDRENLKLANQSTTLAVSSVLPWMGPPPFETSGYQFTQRYIDEQLQVVVSTAGNLHGNHTVLGPTRSVPLKLLARLERGCYHCGASQSSSHETSYRDTYPSRDCRTLHMPSLTLCTCDPCAWDIMSLLADRISHSYSPL